MEVTKVINERSNALTDDLSNAELLNESEILITSVNYNIEKLSEKFQSYALTDDLSNAELLNESEILITSVNDNIEKLGEKFQSNCIGNIEQHLEGFSISQEKLLELYSKLPTKVEYSNSAQNISDVINKQSETISESTTKLVEAISTIPDGSYGLAITSGIIGAIVAAVAVFFANFFYLSHVNSKNKKAHFANVALSLLGDFEKSATIYWISAKIKDKRNKSYNEIDMKLT
jgi:methyl-accepting chemotaxis protein